VKSITTLVAVLALSLAIWVFFYEKNLKLQPSDTMIVVGFCLAVVLFTRWIWARMRNRQGKQSKAAKL
jgi:protein-S-isoprenylcysteine O-methyltransferase Ste14